MALVSPIASQKIAFDATNNEVFYFTSNGGDQVVKNRLTVRKQSDNSIVYQAIVETFLFQQEVPANTLINGTYYNFYFNTFDSDDNMSANSNVVQFHCYEQPVLTITNMPITNIIENTTYTFSALYTQTQGELMSYMVFRLYDASGVEISNSGNMYSTLTPPITLTHTFSGFNNNTVYKIRVEAISLNGTIVYSPLYQFTAVFSQPALVALNELTNSCEGGYVQIKSNIIIATGVLDVPEQYLSRIEDGNAGLYIKWDEWYTPIDGKISVYADTYALSLSGTSQLNFVDILDGNKANYIKWDEWFTPVGGKISVYADTYKIQNIGTIGNLTWDDGFSILSDFQYQIWNQPVRDGQLFEMYKASTPTNKLICELKSGIPSGETTIKNWFEFHSSNGTVFDYSNYVDAMKVDTDYTIWIKKVGDTYTLLLDVIDAGDGYEINWNGADVYPSVGSKVHTNIDTYFPIDTLIMTNGIYNNLDITKNTARAYSQSFPSWDSSTRLNCNFNGNLTGGNVTYTLEQLNGVKIKRRLNGTFDWITLHSIPVSSIDDLNIARRDCGVPSGKMFDYAIVPVLNGDLEGEYITSSVETSFRGTYICDGESIFRFDNGVNYPTISNNLTAGQIVPIGARYPIMIYNSENDYDTGGFVGNLLGDNFLDTRVINRYEVEAQAELLSAMLKKKKGFFIKDWNGKIKLVKVSSGISQTPDMINGKIQFSFQWVEQGQYNNQSDLYYNGIISVLQ